MKQKNMVGKSISEINIDKSIRYFEQISNDNSKKLFLLLHGYQQTAGWIFQKLCQQIKFSGDVIALNAPIPVDHLPGASGFAWYMFNPAGSVYLTPMQFAVDYIKDFLQKKQLMEREITIIGYSQGGYMAPFVAKEIPQTKRVVGINSRFRSETLKDKYSFSFESINGSEDKMVDAKQARACHKEILSYGNRGSFHLLEGEDHSLSNKIVSKIGDVLADC